jgi:hypothetical protein
MTTETELLAKARETALDFSTRNRRWFVHDACEANPFDDGVWLGEFTDKQSANEFARKLRQERAEQAAARYRIATEQAVIDALRAENEALRERIRIANSVASGEN